jgi:hypothetical protein
MTAMTQDSIGFVALMTLRAFNVTGPRDMVAVRIFFIIFRSLGNRIQRFMTGKAAFRICRCLRLGFFMTSDAGHAPAFMAIRSKTFFLFLANASNYSEGNNYDQTTNDSL